MAIDTSAAASMREARMFGNVLWTVIYLAGIYCIEYFTGYGIYTLAIYAVYALHYLQSLQVINSVEINQALNGLDQRVTRIEKKLELQEFEYVSPDDRLSRFDEKLDDLENRIADIEEVRY
ncbi:MAG: hypothetical protein CO158_06310 [Piscirickettsiaceae bacterium CG_4_9_14_3_um_filter_43_564]|nr:hypothetical protein [Thiomicrospira sp.]PIQ02615.1 MAG: hypothetical protein COW74_10670 [Piscirickettsiaceae bacterium CG18_big_fil_WC_8_21_14_2_50_44_103]PIX80973.1 MAG: hypothetical protein COZ36_00285 [Piscirickettsiaceae bacterium CG_4_10_14_3_um_filter_44_349]PJA65854.1 MAG: hypothetical protein CO158_06310 [Piscirickettsiaceae bacterium CG_4_9_14_3_um_filter_43_564]